MFCSGAIKKVKIFIFFLFFLKTFTFKNFCAILYLPFEKDCALVAQLDRAFVYGTKGLGFESPRVHQNFAR